MAFALWAANTTHCARAALQALPSPFPDFASAKFAGLKTPAGSLACAAMIEIPQDAPGSGRRSTTAVQVQSVVAAGKSTLFAVESHAELEEIQCAIAGPPQPARAPSTHPPPDPDRGQL